MRLCILSRRACAAVPPTGRRACAAATRPPRGSKPPVALSRSKPLRSRAATRPSRQTLGPAPPPGHARRHQAATLSAAAFHGH
jgi:hypothetical protein